MPLPACSIQPGQEREARGTGFRCLTLSWADSAAGWHSRGGASRSGVWWCIPGVRSQPGCQHLPAIYRKKCHIILSVGSGVS